MIKQYKKPSLFKKLNTLHPLSNGLVGCWIVNEGKGGYVNNYASKLSKGKITGYEWGASYIGSVLTGNGADEYVDCGIDLIPFLSPTAITVSARFILNSMANDGLFSISPFNYNVGAFALSFFSMTEPYLRMNNDDFLLIRDRKSVV